MRMIWTTSWFMGCAILLTVASGCTQKVSGQTALPDGKEKAPEKVLIPVEVSKPVRRDISSYFETTSRVLAENRVEVISKGTGACQKVYVEEGNKVTAGQVLAELDRKDLETQIRQARIALQQHKTHFEIAEKSVAEGIGAPVERDNARFAYEQAKAALEAQELQLSYQTVTAPISGIITRRVVQEGMLVSAGMPLFSIVDPMSYALPIQVPEKELPRIAEGQLAYVRIDAAEGQEFKARVRRVNPSVDAATGTVKVMLDFDAVDKEKLRDAAFARVRLVMDTRSQVLAVPKDAVLEDNARNYVMVAEPADSSVDTEQTGSNDTGNMTVYIARKVEVETGLDDGDYIEITKGLDENASVIVMGQHTLKPDSLVTITTADKEIAVRQDIPLDEALARAKKKQEEEEQKKRAEQEALNQQQ